MRSRRRVASVSQRLHRQREFDLEPADNARLANLCGPLDENLRLLESRLDVRSAAAATAFRVERRAGAEAPRTRCASCSSSPRTEEVTPRARAPGAARARRHGRRRRRARGETSSGGARAARRHPRARRAPARLPGSTSAASDLTFGIGPAGTGKTYLAVACAVEALQADRVRRIVLVRPAVEAGERLGFLPGDLTQKVDPYLRPMYDALYEMMGFDRVARFIERNVIEVAPLAFMRGRSLTTPSSFSTRRRTPPSSR